MSFNQGRIILDIETRPNEAMRSAFISEMKEDLSKADINKAMATSHEYCEIVCIGIKKYNGGVRILESLEELADERWATVLSTHEIVGFNIKRFDLPVIIKHGKAAGLSMPYARLRAACKPYGYGEGSCDLMEEMAMGDTWKSLDTYMQRYLGIEKETKSQEFFDTATKEEIMKHCEQDLVYTEQLYKYWNE